MPDTSPLIDAANAAASKIRSQITRTLHDRYPWLFISPSGKEDVRHVVECLLNDESSLRAISDQTGAVFGIDPWLTVEDFYPVVWTKIAGRLKPPFPKSHLIMIGLEYMDQFNGLPEINKASLKPGEWVVVPQDREIKLTEGGGGTSIFLLLKRS